MPEEPLKGRKRARAYSTAGREAGGQNTEGSREAAGKRGQGGH